MQPRLITLTTDFGSRDAYVAAMKAVIFEIAGTGATILDVTHEIAAQDVMEAAFVLSPTLDVLPPNSINVVVVDPGVGTGRRGVAVRLGEQILVGPDNGVLTLILNQRTADEMVELDRPEFWRCPDPAPTFHGRDVFAAVAAHLANGVPLDRVGTPVYSLTPLHWALPIVDDQGIRGWVVHVDRYGNCITNITRLSIGEIESDLTGGLKLYVGNARLEGVRRTYADVAAGEPLALVGSNGFAEIAVNAGNASTLLGIGKGSPVNLLFTGNQESDHPGVRRGMEFATGRQPTTEPS